jgi:formylglycine-generating enzyme required for sulfatase activity
VAHEAIFRRWDRLRDWIAAEREFLVWRSALEAGRRGWQRAPESAKQDALLMGLALAQAQRWLAARASDLSEVDREFIELSVKRELSQRMQQERLRRRANQMRALVGLVLAVVAAGLAWAKQDYLRARAVTLAEVIWPKALSPVAERGLKGGDVFKECADCPEMVVLPAGEFLMGSPANEEGRDADESPLHIVVVARPFAVARFELTFDEWDACVTLGGCTYSPSDQGWGRGTRPVINVSWNDAQQYVAWLSARTGRPYRLLSEAEWEYAARSGSDKPYPWGGEIGNAHANCAGCGSQWDASQTAPAGSFAPNAFGLYDMHGNVSEWVQDCAHASYSEAPGDGSAWAS